MQAGGIIASTIALSEATLGAGALSLPIAFASCGVPLTVALLIVMAILSVASLTMIVRAVSVTQCYTYEELTHIIFGRKWEPVVEITMALFCFGTALSYLITVGDILNPMFDKLFDNDKAFPAILLTNRKILSTEIVAFILLPMSLCEKINDIRFIALAGVTCICLLVTCVFYLFARHGMSEEIVTESIVAPTGSFGDVIAAISTFTFAYCNQPNVPQIYEELSRRNESKMFRVIICTLATCFSVYCLIGIPGFLQFANIDASVVKYLVPNKEKGTDNGNDFYKNGDMFTCISLLAMSFGVCCAYPLNIFPTRTAIMLMFGIPRSNKLASVSISVGTVLLSLVLALFLTDFNTVLGFVGGTTGTIISFIIPPLFCLRLQQGPQALSAPQEVTKAVSDEVASDKTSDVADDKIEEVVALSPEQIWQRSQEVKWAPKSYYYGVLIIGSILFVVCSYQATRDLMDGFKSDDN